MSTWARRRWTCPLRRTIGWSNQVRRKKIIESSSWKKKLVSGVPLLMLCGPYGDSFKPETTWKFSSTDGSPFTLIQIITTTPAIIVKNSSLIIFHTRPNELFYSGSCWRIWKSRGFKLSLRFFFFIHPFPFLFFSFFLCVLRGNLFPFSLNASHIHIRNFMSNVILPVTISVPAFLACFWFKSLSLHSFNSLSIVLRLSLSDARLFLYRPDTR